uniref:Gfo/Idh/MocA-like oxidoreductase N-terminal domain-containing protein n=1 Tax=Aureoumbra lagunensis TaxID=44058 RepID=A0A7S3JXH6_9STRA|mmetsp:Transcript_11568/g.15755  ORF Transcript_11568/g.15755 Transcript_11568/m.15755 type:complete len:371 (+) Transcript_11568:52-1164(+)
MISEEKKIIRVGVMGTAAIAKKNALAISRSSRVELVGVASRTMEKAEAWVKELGLSNIRCFEGYEALVNANDVDAVYVPLPTTYHLEWVLKLARKKKNILIEKPVGTTLAQVEEMIQVCREQGVVIMDGTMFFHHPRFLAMKRFFDDKLHWHPKRVTSAFSFYGGNNFLDKGNIRTRKDADPLGCLGDVGWYCIRIGLAAFRFETPSFVQTRVHDQSDDGVLFDLDCDVFFSNDALLTFHCSFKHHLRSWFEAYSRDDRYGGRIIRCTDFVIPRREEYCDFSIEELPDQQTIEYDTIVNTSHINLPFSLTQPQETLMWNSFAELILDNNALERRAYYERAMLMTQQVLQAALQSAQTGGAKVSVPPLTSV